MLQELAGFAVVMLTHHTCNYLPPTTEEVNVFTRIRLSVCVQDYSKTCASIWMKCCVSTDVGTWTNRLTFEPDPDHSPDAGTRLLSPIAYGLQRRILLCWENLYWRVSQQRRMVLSRMHCNVEFYYVGKIPRTGTAILLKKIIYTTSVAALLDELGWLPLFERRKHSRLTIFHKALNNLSPFSLDHVSVSSRHTRASNENKSVSLPVRTDVFQYSFFLRPLPIGTPSHWLFVSCSRLSPSTGLCRTPHPSTIADYHDTLAVMGGLYWVPIEAVMHGFEASKHHCRG